jgi:hypothetical protein
VNTLIFVNPAGSLWVASSEYRHSGRLCREISTAKADITVHIRMSALGQKRTCALQNGMSALPPKADIRGAKRNVRYGPIAYIVHSLELSLRSRTLAG